MRAGVDVFVPRNCTVEDLEVELTARHLTVKVAGWGAFRRHWTYTCRSDEASWHLVDDDGRRKVRVDCRFRGLPVNGPKTKESVTQRQPYFTSVAAARARASRETTSAPHADRTPCQRMP